MHTESLRMPILGASSGDTARDSPMVDTAQPGPGSHPPPALCSRAGSCTHPASTYPAGLAEPPFKQRVEGGRVPPPAGQTALCRTDGALLSPGKGREPVLGSRPHCPVPQTCAGLEVPEAPSGTGPTGGSAPGTPAPSPFPLGAIKRDPGSLPITCITPHLSQERTVCYLRGSRCCS